MNRKHAFLAKFEEVENLEKFEPQEFVFESPLYTSRQVIQPAQVRQLFRKGDLAIDGYCTSCERTSVFHTVLDDDRIQQPGSVEYFNGTHVIPFECQRDRTHKIEVVIQLDLRSDYFQDHAGRRFEKTTGQISKIGQLPSHADISNGDLRNLNKIVTGTDRAEFIRANGLAAHGVNIGSYVYLRRVFERLLLRAKNRVKGDFNDEAFGKARVADKIKMLEGYVPAFMSKNTKIYGVLSKGIHELDEEMCGRYYEVLRGSCLLMLEQEKELKEQEDLETNLSTAISAIDLE